MIPLLPCCFNKTFSGFKSQWISRLRLSKSRHCSIEWANFRTSWRSVLINRTVNSRTTQKLFVELLHLTVANECMLRDIRDQRTYHSNDENFFFWFKTRSIQSIIVFMNLTLNKNEIIFNKTKKSLIIRRVTINSPIIILWIICMSYNHWAALAYREHIPTWRLNPWNLFFLISS